MRKGRIVRILDGTTDPSAEARCEVSPLEDAGVVVEAVLPWYLRGKSGRDLGKGDEVLYESYVDGSAFVHQRADGTWGGVLYGAMQLGADAGTDYAALAQKVLGALSDIQSQFNSHTHSVPGVTPGSGAATSAVVASPLWPTGAPSVAAEKVKVK